MSDEVCPRQIIFTIPGAPSVEVIATERNGAIQFSVDLQNDARVTGDLRALFFHVDPSKLPGLTVSDGGSLLTQHRVSSNNVLDLGRGANLAGAVKSGFDVGVEWGSQGKDGIDYAVGFVLSNAANNLTLDDIAHQLFGVRLDSVSGPGSRGGSAVKLTGIASAAPDARDDTHTIYEDGQKDGLASKTPTGVVLDVLANDTDADNQELTITGIHKGPSHGTVAISADGKSVIYTPALDYAGSDSFVYCVSDGNGGQDSAVVNLTVTAVADDPTFIFSAVQGDNINETILTVTASQNDADDSEYLTNLTWLFSYGVPAGATVVPLSGEDLESEPSAITKQFKVTTTAGQDWDFDLTFSAESVERSNGDTEIATATNKIEIDFNSNQETQTYEVGDQSIWSSGAEYEFNYAEFIGIEESFSDSSWDLATGYDVSAAFKVGFGVDVSFSAGSIDATVPVDVQVETTYNKTTDMLLIDPSIAIGPGARFETTGPMGHVTIDSVFSMSGSALVQLLGVDLFNESFDQNYSTNIFDIASNMGASTFQQFGGSLNAYFAWPYINVTGAQTGSGESDPFFTVVIDVDDVVFTNAGYGNFMDEFEDDPTDFELLDLDLTGGLKLMQDFALDLGSQSVQLRLEDGTLQTLTWGAPMTIANASSHDKNGDGKIEFSLDFVPPVMLKNDTDIGADLTLQLTLLRNHGLGLFVDDPLFDQSYPLMDTERIDIYDSTFALGGMTSQNFSFIV